MDKRIAIIGAGLAGATAADILNRAGAEVVVFEKSGGVGGRLSTRRTAAGPFDHGAQYLTARGSDFRDTLERLAKAEAVAVWLPEGKDRNTDWYVGTPGMSGLLKPLLAGVDVRCGKRVAEVEPGRDVVRLTLDDGTQHVFDCAITAVPAPQCLALLDGSDTAFDVIRQVEMAPCWAAMFGFEKRLDAVKDVYRGRDDAPIAWVARNTSKSGRDGFESIVMHAGGAWSSQHLEDDQDMVAKLLCASLQEMAGDDAFPPLFAVAHRWRYARVDKPAGVAFLAGCDDRVFAVGDWCLGGRAEAAFDSGSAAAVHIMSKHLELDA